jgi:hypothetical protein
VSRMALGMVERLPCIAVDLGPCDPWTRRRERWTARRHAPGRPAAGGVTGVVGPAETSGRPRPRISRCLSSGWGFDAWTSGRMPAVARALPGSRINTPARNTGGWRRPAGRDSRRGAEMIPRISWTIPRGTWPGVAPGCGLATTRTRATAGRADRRGVFSHHDVPLRDHLPGHQASSAW